MASTAMLNEVNSLLRTRSVKYRKSLGEDHLLNLLILGLGEQCVNMRAVELDECYIISALNKRARRQLEDLLYSVAEDGLKTGIRTSIYEKDIDASLLGKLLMRYHEPYSKNLDIIKAWFDPLGHIEVISNLKSKLYKLARQASFTEEEVLADLETYRSLFNERNHAQTVWVVYYNLLVILCLIKFGRVPVYIKGDDTFVYYRPKQSAYKENIKNYLDLFSSISAAARTDRELKLNNRRLTLFCYTLCKLPFTLKTVANDHIVDMMVPDDLYIPFGWKNISDAADENMQEVIPRLAERKRMLPPAGLMFTNTSLLEIFGTDVIHSEHQHLLAGQQTYHLNEITTVDDHLYLMGQVSRAEGTLLFVCEPKAGCECLYAAVFADEDGDMTGDTLMFNLILGVYELMVNELDFDIIEPESTNTKQKDFRGVSEGLFKTLEHKFINGYVRKLPKGSFSSYEAQQSASALGINLRDDETYVRPFVREQTVTINAQHKAKPVNLIDVFK